jgi:hypothetical protein
MEACGAKGAAHMSNFPRSVQPRESSGAILNHERCGFGGVGHKHRGRQPELRRGAFDPVELTG